MNPILTLLCMAETGGCRFVARGFKAILRPLAIGFAFLAGSTAPAAEENAPLRVGLETFAEPLSFTLPDGRVGGFSVDLIEAVARAVDLQVQPVSGPWADIFGQFQAGDIDVLVSVAYSRERDAFIDFAVPHLTMRGAVFVRKGDRSIRTRADLRGKRFAVHRDSFSHGYLRTHGWAAHLTFVNDLREAFVALDEGRCDAVTCVRIVGQDLVRTHKLKNVVASNIELNDYTFNLHMGVPAGEADRLALLNAGLARIRANGIYEQLHEKWIGPLEPRELRLKDLRPMILPLAIVALGVGVAFWWQRRLLRRFAEQAARLRQSEERLSRVLEGSEDGFWDWDMESNRIERSERWASMLGYTLAEIGPSLEAGTALVHPDDRTSYDAWQQRLNSRNDDRCDIEYRLRAKSGEWRWILDRGKIVARAPDGRPIRMSGTHTDITERKKTEAALIESQALLKRSAQLLEQTQAAAHIGGWETDLCTGRVYWTNETYRIHDATPGEFFPTREAVFAFYAPESRQRLLAAVELAIRDGTPYSLDLELITARQRHVHVHTSGVAEKENGRVVKLYGCFRDITRERAAEQEREGLRLKMLEAQKLESLGVLAGGIAHDFNNLLTVILANASCARDAADDAAEHLEHIESAARRAADLCRQMLAYAGKGTFVVQPLDLGALVRDTTELIHVSISKKARLQLALAESLPLVEGDASQLRQVVMNLVINASEAIGDHAGEIRIAIRQGRPDAASAIKHAFDLPPGPCVCLEISDTGHGMTAATLARIFDPFYTTKFTGRGLGLAAVLGIVRAHRGALTVDSLPERGSIFRLFLPVSTRPSLSLGTRAPAPDSALLLRASGTVLIADDEPIVLETAGAVLRRRGFETVLAKDGHDAVGRFRENPNGFCAVLLDLTMPGLGGAEALRMIRSVNSKVPVLVMSGFGEQDVFERVRGLGHVSFVRKPFTQDMLLSRVAEVVKV